MQKPVHSSFPYYQNDVAQSFAIVQDKQVNWTPGAAR